MSLFQCEHCGCMENTALSPYWSAHSRAEIFDWADIEERKGQYLCSACAPSLYSDGSKTEYGKWHNRFERIFLQKGMFVTDGVGNLAHKDTGDTDIRKYALENPQ